MRRWIVSGLGLVVVCATPLMAASCLPQNNTAINYGFTSGGPLVASLPIGVWGGSPIVASATHVYYVGSDHRIYDHLRNGATWQGGTWPLNAGGPLVRAGSEIVNDGDVLYYVGTGNFCRRRRRSSGAAPTSSSTNRTSIKSTHRTRSAISSSTALSQVVDRG